MEFWILDRWVFHFFDVVCWVRLPNNQTHGDLDVDTEEGWEKVFTTRMTG